MKPQIFVYITIYFCGAQATFYKWKYTLEADDPKNYVLHETNSNCNGFYFPEFKDICMMSLHKIRTNRIIFPENGDIYLKEGAEIVFDPNVKACVKVKDMEYKSWLDPNSWESEKSKNLAVPHLERTPCHCDNVVFPNSLYAVSLPTFSNFIKSLDFGIRLKDHSCPLMISDGGMYFANERICTEDTNICQDEKEKTVLNELCPLIKDEDECLDGIELIGHCKRFCGVVIHVFNNPNVDYKRLLDFVNFENIDVYRSKVRKNDKVILQISLTDKNEYNGDIALKIAENRERIKETAKNLAILKIDIYTSGLPNAKHQTFLIPLCTFLIIVFVFGGVYGAHEKNFKFNFRINRNVFPHRFNLSRYNQVLRRSVVFSRFGDNENVSIAGSVSNLKEEEFENPLYEEEEAKTEE